MNNNEIETITTINDRLSHIDVLLSQHSVMDDEIIESLKGEVESMKEQMIVLKNERYEEN